MKESKLQKHVQDLLDSDGLLPKIQNRDAIIQEAIDEANFGGYPEFPIDSLIRKKSLMAARHVLEQLSLTEVLSATKNISLRRDERLLPDFVLYNPERGSFVIVELKTSEKTEREAVTEMFGYEHELQNQFPFLSTYDVSFVLIATDYSTLLNHSAGAMVTWGNRKLLCLKFSETSDQEFDIHLPTPWSALGQDSLPPSGLTTVTLSIHSKNKSNKDYSHYAIRALSMIAEEGDRNHVHGFAFLWQPTHPHTTAVFAITIGTINPFAFVSNALSRGFQVAVGMHTKILETVGDPSFLQPDSVFSVAERAKHLLSEVFNPIWEGTRTWDHQRVAFITNASPLAFRFFGSIGEYVSDLILNADVRRQFLPILDVGKLDTGNPYVAIQILDRLTGNILFKHGRYSCEDLVSFGVLVGSLGTFYKTILSNESKSGMWRSISEWREFELLSAAAEIIDRCNAMEDDIVEPPQLVFGWDADLNQKTAAISEYIGWFSKHFLSLKLEPNIYKMFFQLGVSCHSRLDEIISESLGADELSTYETQVVDFSKRFIKTLISEGIEDSEVSQEFIYKIQELVETNTEDRAELLRLVNSLPDQKILDGARKKIPALIDLLVPPMFHNIAAPTFENVNWSWVRQQVLERRRSGITDVGVFVMADGTFGISQMQWIGNQQLTDEEVLLSIEYAGFKTVVVSSWEDIINGKAFRKPNKTR